MSLITGRVKQFLPDRDYLPLALPTSDMDVLWVSRASGGPYADLALWPMCSRRPPRRRRLSLSRRNAIVVDATGEANRSAKLGLTLSVVNTIITALGGKAGLSLTPAGAAKVAYAYTDVRADTVNLVKLDGWLAKADLNHASPRVTDMLIAEKIFVVVGALKASGIVVSLFDSADQSVRH